MIKGRKIIAVVPARGKSKGIKMKNIFPLSGKPLLYYTAKIIHRLEYVDRAIVSTDNEEIANVAGSCGLDVPFYRPIPLSGDLVSDWEVLNHALSMMEKIDKRRYDIILMLQPTSPFRNPEYVTKTIISLIDHDYDAVWTVSPTDPKAHPLKQLVIQEDLLNYYDSNGAKIIARQQLSTIYHRNGVAYAINRECLLEKQSIKGDKTGAIIIDEPVVNIDSMEDIYYAEYLIKSGRIAFCL
jgi:CMP-N,N'-diacetyllegionaminic acid synthase